MGIEGVRTAPYRIETDRLVIRCYEPADGAALKEAVDASIEHLRPWMPWIRFEPQTVEERIEYCRTSRADFDGDESYTYGIFARDESRLLGGSGLHARGGPASLEVGYWIRSDSLRQGIATEVAAVLTRAAFEVCGVERVDVQIDPENDRSAGVPRKLGFTLEGTLRRRLEPKQHGGRRRDSMLFTMVEDELAVSACPAYRYVAYDALGRTITPSASA
jgi:RimJ/RimL family protein N-acetyltransferase